MGLEAPLECALPPSTSNPTAQMSVLWVQISLFSLGCLSPLVSLAENIVFLMESVAIQPSGQDQLDPQSP